MHRHKDEDEHLINDAYYKLSDLRDEQVDGLNTLKKLD